MPPLDPPGLLFVLIDTLSTVFELVFVAPSAELMFPSLLKALVVVLLIIVVSFLFDQHNRSITSNTDNISLANTFPTFETNLTAAITTIFEEQNKARVIERKDAADAEAKREEQRRQDILTREQYHRDEKQ